LVGQNVIIELKDDKRVSGLLEEVDAFMNCTLIRVTVSKEDKVLDGDFKEISKHESLFVKGTKIRFVEYDDQDEIQGMERVLKQYQSEHESRINCSKRQPKKRDLYNNKRHKT